jgi:mono/diheme cytochrome c family protein
MHKRIIISITILFLTSFQSQANAQEAFTKEFIEKGRSIYSQNCSPCHGPQMADPQGAFDLRIFPPEQKNRFLNSVTNGKNSMPPWGGLFNKVEIESLWAYVMAGEKKN